MQIHEITRKPVTEGLLDNVKTAVGATGKAVAKGAAAITPDYVADPFKQTGKVAQLAAQAGKQAGVGHDTSTAMGKVKKFGAQAAAVGKALTSNNTLHQAQGAVNQDKIQRDLSGVHARLDKMLQQEAERQVKQWMADWAKKKPVIQKNIDTKFPAHNSAEAHVSDENPNVGLGMNEAGVPAPNPDKKDNIRIADEFKKQLESWMQQKLGATPEQLIKNAETATTNADSIEQQTAYKTTADTLKKQLDAALLYPPQDGNIQAFLQTAALFAKREKSKEKQTPGSTNASSGSSGGTTVSGDDENTKYAASLGFTDQDFKKLQKAANYKKVEVTNNDNVNKILRAAGVMD